MFDVQYNLNTSLSVRVRVERSCVVCASAYDMFARL